MGLLWAMSLPGLVLLLVALAALERLGLWAGRASWLPWRRGRGGPPVSAAGFDEIGAAFYGSKRMELEHRQSQSMLREEEADGAPPNRIDLDSGNVRLSRRPRP
ncbi:MAG TPA: DUF6191 domain-containing protein [Kutzneria sp.]|jgi:hypothetical protein